MFCKNCGNEIKDAGSFCGVCGTPIGQGGNYCANCGSAVIPGAVVCSQCGTAINSNGACSCGSCQEQPQQAASGISDTNIQPNVPYTYAPPAEEAPKKKAMGITGFVFSLLNLFCCCVSLPLGIVGIVLCAVSMKNKEDCRGLAITGLIIGIIGTVIGAVMILIACISGSLAIGSANMGEMWQEFLEEFQNMTF